MSRDTKRISESALQTLVDAGAILNAFIIEDGDGRFHILCRSVKGVDHLIQMKRGGDRRFKTIDAAAKLLRSMGINRISLHLSEYSPNTVPLLD